MATARQSVEAYRVLLGRLEDARRLTDALFGVVKPEHRYDRPIPERGIRRIFSTAGIYTMEGGSPRTAAAMLRSSFRSWFQPHYPYIYAGFRCVSA